MVHVKTINIKNVLKVITANSIYKSDSVPNILITTSGHNSKIKVAIIPTRIVETKTVLYVCLTLSIFLAPKLYPNIG